MWKDALEPLRLILQLGALVVAATLGPLLVGVWFDRRFGTSPWALCLSGLVALVLSMASVYRVTRRFYAEADRQRRAKEEQRQ